MAYYSSLNNNDDLERNLLSQQKQLIKTSKKSNYGSLRNETKQTTTAFMINYKHKLQAGETLQGISLKYGVPIENIKRANKLWSNDVAFVKDTLIIPIDKERLKELNLAIDEYSDCLTPNDVNIVSNDKVSNGQNGHGASNGNKSNDSNKNDDNNNNKNEAYKDYLNKFDTFINESKLKLKSLESNPK